MEVKMLGSDYQDQNCSIARTLELVGERWTILVLRDVFLGRRRFSQLRQSLGVARNVLAARLDRLVGEGILEKVPYQERPLRHEYRLTSKGLDLWPVIVELLHWGDRHAAPAAGPPIVLRHKDCGGELGAHRICTRCGEPLEVGDVRAEAGPGAGDRVRAGSRSKSKSKSKSRSGSKLGSRSGSGSSREAEADPGLRRSARASRPARPATA
jgi:DNA-binding HxlR family transcriptional regulator